MKLRDLTNQRFGKWTALDYVRIGGRGKWRCKCACGTERLIWGNDLTHGRTANCGCVRRTHGMTKSREFETWNSMRKRCLRMTNHNYKNYGGRGIKVCRRWLNSFASFYADMGPKPAGAQLDRINNDGVLAGACGGFPAPRLACLWTISGAVPKLLVAASKPDRHRKLT